jgi:hypothetical protein
MESKQILERIIKEDGNCCWSKPSICRNCPLSKLKTDSNGNYLNCVEAVGATSIFEEEADALYKKVAEKLLLEMEVHNILTNNSEV